MRDASASVLTGFPEEGKGIQSGAAMWKEMNMEATLALAPALGADAASLVGRALHEATRVQAAWRACRAARVPRGARTCGTPSGSGSARTLGVTSPLPRGLRGERKLVFDFEANRGGALLRRTARLSRAGPFIVAPVGKNQGSGRMYVYNIYFSLVVKGGQWLGVLFLLLLVP